MKGWIALDIALPAALEEEILAALSEAGTLGIRIAGDGAGEEAGRRAAAYFEEGADFAAIDEALDALGPGLLLGRSEVRDEMWVERQEEARAPIEIGERFLVMPSAGREDARGVGRDGADRPRSGGGNGRIVLLIPATRAFGTGEHATTRMCLERLEAALRPGEDVLDVGTGSGILAIAAMKLGARRVVALDADPEAARVARDNLAPNGLAASRAIAVVTGEAGSVAGGFDLILANLYARVLESIAPLLATLQERSGRLIASGFPPAEASRVARAFAETGYREAARTESGDWAVLVLEKE